MVWYARVTLGSVPIDASRQSEKDTDKDGKGRQKRLFDYSHNFCGLMEIDYRKGCVLIISNEMVLGNPMCQPWYASWALLVFTASFSIHQSQEHEAPCLEERERLHLNHVGDKLHGDVDAQAIVRSLTPSTLVRVAK